MDTGTPLRNYLSKIGLGSDVTMLYIALCMYGPQSLLQLSRNARIERTRMYRLLDSLKDYYLIEEEVQYKRKIYRAAPFSNLEALFSRQRQQLHDLETEMHQIAKSTELPALDPSTCVQFYRGRDGIKQMLWNETRSTTENLSILHENMQSRTERAFFERWVERCNANGIPFRSIINDNFILTQQRYAHHASPRLRAWQAHHVPDDVYAIANCMVIYNDVVAWYDWRDNELFGIEIHNGTIANGKRQFFEILWAKAGQQTLQPRA